MLLYQSNSQNPNQLRVIYLTDALSCNYKLASPLKYYEEICKILYGVQTINSKIHILLPAPCFYVKAIFLLRSKT